MNVRTLGVPGLAATATLALVVLVSASFSAAQAQPIPVGDGNQPTGISVVGQGVVLAQPTQGMVVFGVEVVNRSLAAAQQDAANRMDAVVNKLIELGVDRRDLKTVRFSVQPQYDQQGRTPTLTGYRVSNAVAATLKDINAIGGTIDAAVEAGAVRVEGVTFHVADPSQLKDQAREQAVVNARSKAEQLARLSGVTLGRPIRIEESDPGGVRPVEAQPAARAALAAETPILAGELEIRTQVRVVFAIQ